MASGLIQFAFVLASGIINIMPNEVGAVFRSTTGHCTLNACDVFEMVTRGTKKEEHPPRSSCTSDIHWRQLDRRLRAIEETTWTISFGQSRWRQCAKKCMPVRCKPARSELLESWSIQPYI
ncbi:hypothetical protein ACJJTC_015686 [Scirpophaga incertulas]